MAYDVLPDFDTSSLDASKNGQELCNELKRLYDHLMTAVAAQSFGWDKTEIIRNTGGLPTAIKMYKGSIVIEKDYTYAGGFIATKKIWIKGVPPTPADWHYVFGESYARDADNFLISTNKIGQ